MRSCTVIDTVEVKIAAAATKYRTTWRALDALADALLRFDWKVKFPKLKDEDIYSMMEVQAGGLVSEGRRLMAMSWIWKQHTEQVKKNFLKAQACANRWVEEVELVQEEI
ncbi:uncharacterized protein HD556DRAFT_1440768 [Suillus plorans]|uniref:Uncharacterized protein n=1 Tax=Suillus plorans TaxID=116603 RepID=A0A9P7DLH8_9AGAM|nr:uncharacterized protein HD556DRAFT_1440768 [Suillus plorans]KAG1797807.1 hypothetical protein HD556DRAFT_1440768 [Suillus plorans]